jgi:hypothetical protein
MKYLFFFLLLPILAISQETKPKRSFFKDDDRLFKGYVALGANFTQIDGDNSAGYNNIGANGGVGAFIMYSKKFSNSLEISYTMKGARRYLAQPLTANKNFSYQMDYIEIPLLFNYHDFKFAIFQAGFAYSNVIRSKFVYNNSTFPVDFYKWNLDLVVSTTFLIKEHWGINFKFNYSLLNNLDNGGARGGLIGKQNAKLSNRTAGGTNWYHNVLTFRLMYII